MAQYSAWLAQAEDCQYVLADDEVPSRLTQVPFTMRCPGCGERHPFDVATFGGGARD